MAGYSKTPLISKLGIKRGMSLYFVYQPDLYIQTLNLSEDYKKRKAPYDFVQVFVKNKDTLESVFDNLKDELKKEGVLWVSWPKKTSLVKTDINENIIREIGLSKGMVDVKVIAIDETWSGLKFVFRLKDR